MIAKRRAGLGGDMDRRALLGSLVIAGALPTATLLQSRTDTAENGAARLGRRMLAERGAAFVATELAPERRWLRDRPLAHAEVVDRIAAEYRADRTVVIAGLLFSRTEAAAFARAALPSMRG